MDRKLAEEFVRRRGGQRPLRKVLIASNGIAAVKLIRSLRRWSYETFELDGAIQFVAMATPEDLRANAEYIRMADELVEVPGGSNNNNYANVALIVELAQRYRADAVWAGWGHASENPELPDLLNETDITWIGPSGQAMRALGDKIASTLIAQSAGVPCMAWSGSGIQVSYATEGISKENYAKSCASTLKEAMAAADRIGFPIMIKASEGGGGKGIRKVERHEEMEAAFRAVQSEVVGSPIFLMRLASNCRHLEVQLICDEWGQAIPLYGRDCSVQRRHQKIIEEGPVVAATPERWREMEQSAVRLAKEVGYVGAGTVEYLYMENGDYCFLELNPRLQVEHPVSELISGVNLPATQLQIAMGIPLHQIPEIRQLYGENPKLDTRIDFDNTPMRTPPCHVIACRVTAENPDLDFQPNCGTLEELNFRSTPNVWGYFSIDSHGGVHEYADSQFGHLFAVGVDREAARRHMCVALKELCIRGEIRTTIEYLRNILEAEDFRENRVHTRWLEQVRGKNVKATRPSTRRVVLVGAACMAWAQSTERMATFRSRLEKGQQVLNPNAAPLMRYSVPLIYEGVKYEVTVARSGPNRLDISLNGSTVSVGARAMADGGVLISLDGRNHSVYGREDVAGTRVVIDGLTCVFSREYDPSSVCSQISGKLVRFTVADGAHVCKGQAFAEMEMMKMYIPISAEENGVLHHMRATGSVVESGDLIATLDLDDPAQVQKAKVFQGTFTEESCDLVARQPCDIFTDSLNILNCVFDGYCQRPESIRSTLETLLNCMRNPLLPLSDFSSVLSTLIARLPEHILQSLQAVLSSYKEGVEKSRFFWETLPLFPVSELTDILENSPVNEAEFEAVSAHAVPLRAVLERHRGGSHMLAVNVLKQLLQRYLDVEIKFANSSLPEFVIQDLRHELKSDLDSVAAFAMAHAEVTQRTALVCSIVDTIENRLTPLLEYFVPVLKDLCALRQNIYEKVVIRSRKVLVRQRLPSMEVRRTSALTLLSSVDTADATEARLLRLMPLIDAGQDNVDVLFDIISSARSLNCDRIAAFEVYARRLYRAFVLGAVEVKSCKSDGGSLMTRFSFHAMMRRRTSLHHIDSLCQLSSASSSSVPAPPPPVQRLAVVQWVRCFAALKRALPQLLELFSSSNDQAAADDGVELLNVLHLCIQQWPGFDEDEVAGELHALVKQQRAQLRKQGVRRVTFAVVQRQQYPRLFTFRQRLDYEEDPLVRNLEPTLAAHLELSRLANFADIVSLPTTHHMVRLFKAHKRLFARTIVRFCSGTDSSRGIASEAEQILVEALNSIENTVGSDGTRDNHIFMNFLPNADHSIEDAVEFTKILYLRYAASIRRNHVTEVELRLRMADEGVIRLVCTNPTGWVLKLYCYVESLDSSTNSFHYSAFRSELLGELAMGDAPLHGVSVSHPYPVTTPFCAKRFSAEALGTLYVYDFLTLLQHVVEETWGERRPQKTVFSSTELVLSDQNAVDPLLAKEGLAATHRAPGLNDIGMVAWRLHLKTALNPQGRDVVVVANDITHRAGTFSTEEDELFYRASLYARHNALPFLFIAANSGARIGIAAEILPHLQVKWVDSDDPQKGFKYLYLKQDAYDALKDTVEIGAIVRDEVSGERCYVLEGILGRSHGLGVENLSGSGQIAGEASAAYANSFTLSYVSTRCVGIGAYLVRLGQRVIQKQSAPILLTGYQALNKVLGNNVYTSNRQLGGTEIMTPNGVSHLRVENDLEGCQRMIGWLDYVPVQQQHHHRHDLPLVPPPPSVHGSDPIERPVTVAPSVAPYDPRMLLEGVDGAGGGLFDEGSYTETLADWARTIVCGRARLGGMPIGVVAVETRTCEKTVPADPASPDSTEEIIQQAARVWYPDGAYKTAQAITDFNGEGLPLLILANWRGFSGGQRDMFEAILKFGAMIVDALRIYQQPIIVYMPPHAELRGGAWVVVDRTINPNQMEMYASPSARGGILEPAGVVSVKLRGSKLRELSGRLDPKLQAMKQLHSQSRSEQVAAAIAARHKLLEPVYVQVATEFADLHDRPFRMLATGTINGVVEWANARHFLYWRFRRRSLEGHLQRRIGRASLLHALALSDTDTSVSSRSELSLWREFLLNSPLVSGEICSAIEGHDNDALVVKFLESSSQLLLQHARQAERQSSLLEALQLFSLAPNVDSQCLKQDLATVLQHLSPKQLQLVREQLDSFEAVPDAQVEAEAQPVTKGESDDSERRTTAEGA